MKCPIKLKHGSVTDSRFNKKELRIGTRIEMEHTNNPCVAKQIAKGHLSEFPNGYYSSLISMENKLKKQKK